MFLSLFQTASGSWHVQSILIASGWFITGILLFIQLSANRTERIKSFEKEKQHIEELKGARSEISELKKKTTPKPLDVRLRILLDEINPQILKELAQGHTTIKTEIPQELLRNLKRICAEKESIKYIRLDTKLRPEDASMGSINSHGVSVVTRLKLDPSLLGKSK